MVDVEDKRCNKCDTILTDDNWYPSYKKNNLYRCKECDHKQRNDPLKRIRRKVTSSLKDHRRLGIETYGTIDEYEELYDGHCSICGIELDEYGDDIDRSGSLDRIDNELFMTPNNVQWVCTQCNRTKGNRTMDEFKEYINQLYHKFNGSDE